MRRQRNGAGHRSPVAGHRSLRDADEEVVVPGAGDLNLKLALTRLTCGGQNVLARRERSTERMPLLDYLPSLSHWLSGNSRNGQMAKTYAGAI